MAFHCALALSVGGRNRVHLLSGEADYFTALMHVVDNEYHNGLVPTYVDNEGETITIRSQPELVTALWTGSGGMLSLTLLPDNRGQGLSASLATRARNAAARLFNQAVRGEKQITGYVQAAAEANGGVMVGLEHRFKTRHSMERKLRDKAAALADDDEDALCASIKDALRYTIQFETEMYSSGVEMVRQALMQADFYDPEANPSQGRFEFVEEKNYWITDARKDVYAAFDPSMLANVQSSFDSDVGGQKYSDEVSVILSGSDYTKRSVTRTVYSMTSRNAVRRGDEYQGINTVIRNSNTGMLWELQFHTRESLEVKHASHKVYSKFRIAKDPLAKHTMMSEMMELWDSVPRPLRVDRIGKKVGLLAPKGELEPIPPEQEEEYNQARISKRHALYLARSIRARWTVLDGPEPAITDVIEELAATFHECVQLFDLTERLMPKYPLRARISEIAEVMACPLEEAAARVTDALLYNVVVRPEKLLEVAREWVLIMARSNDLALFLVAATNEWPHSRGLTTCWRVAGHDQVFTVRFHTAESHKLTKFVALHGDACEPDGKPETADHNAELEDHVKQVDVLPDFLTFDPRCEFAALLAAAGAASHGQ
ncbi:uncharacterized protein AMSG_09491 [Thecamonas trahens ATCC 50062]|uniref:Uncharacterized protein n=1 Tax=Thecamonas trahens ATCC 50062 TaxID=461836 RepID=A0A0L0DN88_THETB|nr:hypothetical protein AMSG_09491 [Thecamonas trahens ATCC 50062]KNC53774.1 hypothetical protein AMSG_09491 [Thecamonas trahens ATCC 50062]|eukprot:XP_013754336.1 hypothetical protein AMSG_09491 [Thecamonas trahens ATCC 50062]